MAEKKEKKRRGLGLLPKLLIGIFIPILIVFFFLWTLIFYSWDFRGNRFTSLKDIGAESLKELSMVSVKEAKSSLNKLGEKIIKEKAMDVATQIRIYLQAHPKLRKEDFSKDLDFMKVAVQKVGLTGYTALYELPDTAGVWRTWAHVNPKIMFIDMSTLKGPLGKNFPGFWKVYTGVEGGKESSGYYTWQDADGTFREKYMVCTPVAGTPYIIASTTYLDEFSKPSRAIEGRMKFVERGYLDDYEIKIQLFYFVILVALVFILMVVYFYSRSVIRPIRYLSEVADRISMGDLNTPIQIKAKGEVGLLAESFERMQTSVKAAIERLQKRKGIEIKL
jgi:HAMP domain-containing protein